MHCLPFKTIKTSTLRMDHAKLIDVLTSQPISQSILPRDVCFATSRPASHAICSFIDSCGYASGPIRRCLFIDYIIIHENCLPAEDSHEISCLIGYFEKAAKFEIVVVCANYRWRFKG